MSRWGRSKSKKVPQVELEADDTWFCFRFTFFRCDTRRNAARLNDVTATAPFRRTYVNQPKI